MHNLDNMKYHINSIKPLAIIIIIIASLAIIAGTIIPKLLIDSHEDDYQYEEYIFGRFMINQARQAVGGSSEVLLVTAFSISNMKLLKNAESCGYDPYESNNSYYGTVTIFTLFGLPYGEISIDCQGWRKITRYYF